MDKLTKLAIRHAEISAEIKLCKQVRNINLDKCHGSDDKEFQGYWDQEFNDGNHDLVNCLMASYDYVKESRSHNALDSFDEIIKMYGCKNCVGAYDEKRKIGILKQERGRIHSAITNIGKSLMHLQDKE